MHKSAPKDFPKDLLSTLWIMHNTTVLLTMLSEYKCLWKAYKNLYITKAKMLHFLTNTATEVKAPYITG